ncbi:MAG: hypothetical protein E6J71_19505 [Deltaproteobacteria bacterium]|nr:MAG: hypothetical protein E6J71_19505 [Deltaproteobacteria bacterium]
MLEQLMLALAPAHRAEVVPLPADHTRPDTELFVDLGVGWRRSSLKVRDLSLEHGSVIAERRDIFDQAGDLSALLGQPTDAPERLFHRPP